MLDEETVGALADLTDEQLVNAAQSAAPGDHRAFNLLVERYEARIAANCRHLSGSDADVPDLKQEVFVKAYFALPRFEGRSEFQSWLWRIKINHCLRHLERAKRRTFIDIDSTVARASEPLRREASAEAWLEAQDRSALITAVLDSLSDQDRVTLVLRYLDELTVEEVADRLEIGLSAAKMRLKRAKERFAAAYGAARAERATPPEHGSTARTSGASSRVRGGSE